MELYCIILICLAAIFLFVLLFFAGVTLWIQKIRFGNRSEGNPLLKYYTADDFKNIKAEPVSFPSDKGQILRGFLYSDNKYKVFKGLVIWVHGFGAGHNAYTTEIVYLARQGYLVLGYDNTGCVMSDGKKIGGLTQGAIDVEYAIRFVAKDERLCLYKRILVGHSWGGYSAMNIFSTQEYVDGVVAMCGFDSAYQIIADMSKRYFGGFSYLIYCYARLFDRLRFGKYGALSAKKSLQKSEVPVLLLYGEKDGVVYYKTNGKKILETVSDKNNIQSITYPEKGHSVYLTPSAENYMKEIFSKILSPQADKSIASNINYSLITEEDFSVMEKIKEFANSIFQ